MQLFLLSIILILGFVFGSFLNVIIYWLESNSQKEHKVNLNNRNLRKNIFGRSFCPSCKHNLNSNDLIPVISWVFLRGKCRYCGKKVSIQYPLVELATGLIFVATFYFSKLSEISKLSLSIFLLLIINCLLLIIFVYDLKHKIIPDKIIYPAIVLSLSYWLLVIGTNYLYGNISLVPSLYPVFSALVAGGFFYFLAAVSDGKWMGGGDIKLVFFMGLFLGFPNILVAMFFGFLLGSVIGVFLIIIGRKKISSEIPFGPFLITGTWIALFWGSKLIELYMKAFLL